MIIDKNAYKELVDAILEMEPAQLAEILDQMYGRENLPRVCTVEDLRREALAQAERLYGQDYERVLLHRKNAFSASLVRNREQKEE